MMRVGAYEAKTHLPRLLEMVRAGEKVVITKHGVPVAELVPPAEAGRRPASELLAEMRRFRKGRRLGDVTLKELIEDGRR